MQIESGQAKVAALNKECAASLATWQSHKATIATLKKEKEAVNQKNAENVRREAQRVKQLKV